MQELDFANPYRPGAGHQPPYLAWRHKEQVEFSQFLNQSTITDNLILTGQALKSASLLSPNSSTIGVDDATILFMPLLPPSAVRSVRLRDVAPFAAFVEFSKILRAVVPFVRRHLLDPDLLAASRDVQVCLRALHGLDQRPGVRLVPRVDLGSHDQDAWHLPPSLCWRCRLQRFSTITRQRRMTIFRGR